MINDERLAELAEAVNDLGARLVQALVPVFDDLTTMADAWASLGRPEPADPNPFPRIHLFRRSPR